MPLIDIQVNTENWTRMKAQFGSLARQFDYAAARALTDTVKAAQKDYRKALPAIFDRPTPWTLNSAFTRPATKRDLRASVELKHFPTASAADRYLAPEILGGARSLKRFERAIGDGFTVPGSGAKLDAYGNMSRGQIMQILSQLNRVGYQNISAATTKRIAKKGLLVRHGMAVASGSYFIAREKVDGKPVGRPIGIYQLVSRGKVVPVIRFVRRAPHYAARLPFFELIGKSAQKNFGGFFRKRLLEAVATARR